MNFKHNKELCSQIENYTLTIVAEGKAFCGTDWRDTEISPPFTRLYYIIDGSGKIETAEGTLHLTAGNFYMLPLGYSFSHICEDKMQQLYFHINLTNTYGADILQGINKVLSKKISDSHTKRMLSLFENKTVVDRGYFKSLLQADVFSVLSESQIDIKNKRLSASVQKAQCYIEENLSASLTVKTVSDNIFVSPTTLSHSFKAEMGVSIGKYIDGMVMCKAEHLLINTQLPLYRISDELGFYDQFYFSRRFKEKYAVSPLKYRKMHQPVR